MTKPTHSPTCPTFHAPVARCSCGARSPAIGTIWTPKADNLLEISLKQGLSMQQVATIISKELNLQLSRSAITGRAKRLRLSVNQAKNLQARLTETQAALDLISQATLLFFNSTPWTPALQAKWERLIGNDTANSRSLCTFIKDTLTKITPQESP